MTCASSSGSLDSQPNWGCNRIRPPFAPPRKSLPRNVAAAFHAVETSCATDRPDSRIDDFSESTSASEIVGPCCAGTLSCHR